MLVWYKLKELQRLKLSFFHKSNMKRGLEVSPASKVLASQVKGLGFVLQNSYKKADK